MSDGRRWRRSVSHGPASLIPPGGSGRRAIPCRTSAGRSRGARRSGLLVQMPIWRNMPSMPKEGCATHRARWGRCACRGPVASGACQDAHEGHGRQVSRPSPETQARQGVERQDGQQFDLRPPFGRVAARSIQRYFTNIPRNLPGISEWAASRVVVGYRDLKAVAETEICAHFLLLVRNVHPSPDWPMPKPLMVLAGIGVSWPCASPARSCGDR